MGCGGGGGIRTHGTVTSTPVFKTGALNRSATPPVVRVAGSSTGRGGRVNPSARASDGARGVVRRLLWGRVPARLPAEEKSDERFREYALGCGECAGCGHVCDRLL